ncbi:hypothetical protein ACET3Z_022602 [Daucus carota]
METQAAEPRFHQRQRKRSRSNSQFTGIDEEDKEQQHHHNDQIRDPKTVTLPDDIIHNEILTRLPPKHILRCRLVCKSWNSRFSTPDFINSHLTRQQNHPQEEENLVIINKLIVPNGIQILSRTTAIPLRNVPYIRHSLLGSINGLVALSCLQGKRFCLWNPAVGYLKFFPMPPSHSHPTKDQCNHFLGGFAWDHELNDYKLLLFCYDSATSGPSQICVYSSNSAIWTTLRVPPHSGLPVGRILKSNLIMSPSTIVKGIPYWSYEKYLQLDGKRRRRKLISTFKFLPQVNEFRVLPDLDALKTGKNRFHIVNIKDGLFGMAYNVTGVKSLVDIYSLDDEESHCGGVWSKMYTVGPVDISYGGRQLSQCFKNGGDILIYGKRGPFNVYDPETGETKFVQSSDSGCLMACFNYTPSLVCVPGMELMQESFTKEEGAFDVKLGCVFVSMLVLFRICRDFELDDVDDGITSVTV